MFIVITMLMTTVCWYPRLKFLTLMPYVGYFLTPVLTLVSLSNFWTNAGV